jgi:hypothetical protein
VIKYKAESNMRRVAFYFGRGVFGLLAGVQFYERFDWNHLVFGITFLWWYATLAFRWIVANCGYEKGEPYTD